MIRRVPVLFAMAFATFLAFPPVGSSQVPTVKMRGETARERFSMIREDLIAGGSGLSAAVPAKQRLVITDVIVSANAKACEITIERSPSYWDCPGSGDELLVPPLCVPSTGGTVSHTFATGLEIPAGWHACILRDFDTSPGVAQVLIRGYFTKAKK